MNSNIHIDKHIITSGIFTEPDIKNWDNPVDKITIWIKNIIPTPIFKLLFPNIFLLSIELEWNQYIMHLNFLH